MFTSLKKFFFLELGTNFFIGRISWYSAFVVERLRSLTTDEKLAIQSYLDHRSDYLSTMRQKASAIYDDEQTYVEQIVEVCLLRTDSLFLVGFNIWVDWEVVICNLRCYQCCCIICLKFANIGAFFVFILPHLFFSLQCRSRRKL